MEQLYTRWGRELDRSHVLEEYPRPLMVRSGWECLNGPWEYAMTGADEKEEPREYDGTILVPFSPESVLSGVGRQLLPDQYLWYRRSFRTDPEKHDPARERLLLHFGAVDQECAVYVNGKRTGRHTGGYLPFTIDITEALDPGGLNVLKVRVRDLSDTSYHARGKQKLARGGMFYTATAGIWQTVWMEWVPRTYISSLDTETDIDRGLLQIRVGVRDERPERPGFVEALLKVFAPSIYQERDIPAADEASAVLSMTIPTGEPVRIPIPEPRLWDCSEPWLYVYTVELMDQDGTDPDFLNDHVQSYK